MGIGEDPQDWEPGGRGRLGLDQDGAVEREDGVGGSGERKGAGRGSGSGWPRDQGIGGPPEMGTRRRNGFQGDAVASLGHRGSGSREEASSTKPRAPKCSQSPKPVIPQTSAIWFHFPILCLVSTHHL